MNAYVGVTILTERALELARQDRCSWVVAIPPGAAAFVVVPAAIPDRALLSGAAVDRLLQTASAEDRRELVLGGWLVHAYGPAWGRKRLVAALRALVLSGRAGVLAARPVQRHGLVARLRAALSAGRAVPKALPSPSGGDGS
jgi:hypothetical protein